jgi:hypothetical protein
MTQKTTCLFCDLLYNLCSYNMLQISHLQNIFIHIYRIILLLYTPDYCHWTRVAFFSWKGFTNYWCVVHCVINLSAAKFQETRKPARKKCKFERLLKSTNYKGDFQGECSMDLTFKTFLDYLLFLIIQATSPHHHSAVTYIYCPSDGL